MNPVRSHDPVRNKKSKIFADTQTAGRISNGMKNLWLSSYEANNYGDFFFALMRIFKPEKVVELGTKAGYSAYHIARGLKANGKGTLDCYDLWEKYQFKSVPKSVAQQHLSQFRDILHVDLSNEGEILDKIIPQWIDKVRQFIIIEGGSSERDKVEWMKKFKKMPIKKWLEGLVRKSDNIEYFTIEPFPSVTIIRKLT